MTAGTTAGRAPELRRLPLPWLVAATLLPLVLLTILAGVLVSRMPAVAPAAIGQPAPTFALADLDGNPIDLASLRGRPVVVNFWASWCGPCVEEFPLLRDAARAHADDGLAIVGVVYDDRSEAARSFMERNGATWSAAMDPGGRAASAYGVAAVPSTYFIGRDGTVVARQIGQFSEGSLTEKLAAIIDEE